MADDFPSVAYNATEGDKVAGLAISCANKDLFFGKMKKVL
jgi:hypothetical protein